MALFFDEYTRPRHPRRHVDSLSIAAFIVAITGFVTVLGFLIAIPLAMAALMRFHTEHEQARSLHRWPARGLEAESQSRLPHTAGRGLALAALWISIVAIIGGMLALLGFLIWSWAMLPAPQFIFKMP